MNGSCLGRSGARWLLGGIFLLIPLACRAAGTPGTISGTVKAPTGWAVSGSLVTASDANYHLFRTPVGDDGTYTLDSVDPGTYTITIAAKGLEMPPIPDVVVAAGQPLKKDLTLTVAQPFCFVKAVNPIMLADDINSDAFKDAPDIHVDTAMNLNEPVGDLATLNMWGGPATAGGRFRVKYDSAGIHLAADVTYSKPGINLAGPDQQYLGNAIEFDFQDRAYDPTLTSYDPDHNWQLIVGLGATPQWWVYQNDAGNAPAINGKPEPVANHVMIKNRPNNDGELVRIDIPWALYVKGSTMTPITPPADMALGAVELAVDQSGPDSTPDNPTSLFQLTWSGLDTGFQDPSVLKPIQFCLQAP